MNKKDDIKALYDHRGSMFGIFISPKLWAAISKDVQPIIDRQLEKTEKPLPEPMDDWDRLIDFWDFAYEVDTDVSCEQCGSTTEAWMADEPRKFRLKAANIGGMTCFECQTCKARITKRHFKDKITCSCIPYCEKK